MPGESGELAALHRAEQPTAGPAVERGPDRSVSTVQPSHGVLDEVLLGDAVRVESHDDVGGGQLREQHLQGSVEVACLLVFVPDCGCDGAGENGSRFRQAGGRVVGEDVHLIRWPGLAVDGGEGDRQFLDLVVRWDEDDNLRLAVFSRRPHLRVRLHLPDQADEQRGGVFPGRVPVQYGLG